MINVKIFNTAISQNKASMITLGAQNELYISTRGDASALGLYMYYNNLIF